MQADEWCRSPNTNRLAVLAASRWHRPGQSPVRLGAALLDGLGATIEVSDVPLAIEAEFDIPDAVWLV